jgi:pyridoxine 5-phosphate synthase
MKSKSRAKIRLGVNIDHAATLRQVRGGTTSYPDILNIANIAISGGAEQITIHLREDRRHIQERDLAVLAKHCRVPLNLEMAVNPAMIKMAKKYKPDWACFVPEKRQELTTEGGLDVAKNFKKIADAVEKLQSLGIEISMFIAPSIKQVEASYKAGADAVEFHTGSWVHLSGAKKQKEWLRLKEAADLAHFLGMSVHAGHGLDFKTTKEITKLPHLEEVNIGHSLICYSLEYGLEKSVRMMKKCLK